MVDTVYNHNYYDRFSFISHHWPLTSLLWNVFWGWVDITVERETIQTMLTDFWRWFEDKGFPKGHNVLYKKIIFVNVWHLLNLEPEETNKRSRLNYMTPYLICLQCCGEASYLLSVSSCSVPNDKSSVQHKVDTWSRTHRQTLGQMLPRRHNWEEERVDWKRVNNKGN